MSTAPDLFLDLATSCGWAEGRPGERLRSGSFKLGAPGSTEDERYAALFRWLWDRFAVGKPRRVVYEAPMMPARMVGSTTMTTTQFLLGLPAVVRTVCALRGVWKVERANVQDVRHYLLSGRQFVFRGKTINGRRNLDRAAAKHCIGERMRALGYEPANDDEADALAGLLFVHAKLAPAAGSALSPLMESAA